MQKASNEKRSGFLRELVWLATSLVVVKFTDTDLLGELAVDMCNCSLGWPLFHPIEHLSRNGCKGISLVPQNDHLPFVVEVQASWMPHFLHKRHGAADNIRDVKLLSKLSRTKIPTESVVFTWIRPRRQRWEPRKQQIVS